MLRQKFNFTSVEGIDLSETARPYVFDQVTPNPKKLVINHDKTKKRKKANQTF